MSERRIAFDIEKMRPGCAIIQAQFGCDPQTAHEFPTESWLTAPTPKMRCYPVNESQLKQLVAKVEARLQRRT